uniref:Ig-like domain-containing protein n=1 Tax=Phlebotomus papatasi TaxID=29031 RepID=A0A1B0D2W5_PHLPP
MYLSQFAKVLVITGAIAIAHCKKNTLPKSSEQVSLVIVFDTTGSMGDDLEELRTGAAYIVRNVMNKTHNPIYNYIFVPFNDPVVGPALITTDPNKLLKRLDEITVDGGGDCPEKSLSGIKIALEECLPGSFVYITFIAADSNCHVSSRTYDAISEKSNGQIYRIKSRDTNTILEGIADNLENGLQLLYIASSSTAGNHTIPLEIDKNLKDITVSVSGSSPNITISNPKNEPSNKTKNLIDLPRVKAVKVPSPEPGVWTVDASSTSAHSVKISGVSNVGFHFGFALRKPDSINETQPRPIRDKENILCIEPTDSDAISNISTIRLYSESGPDPFELVLPVVRDDGSNQIYCAHFKPPSGLFKIEVKGKDSSGNNFTRILPTGVESSDEMRPHNLGDTLQYVELNPNESTELECKIIGNPEPARRWFRNGEEIPGVTKEILKITFESYKLVEYKCIGSNRLGDATATFKINYSEPPEVIDHLLVSKNNSVIIRLKGDSLSLNCPTKGKPSPTLKWKKDGKLIKSDDETTELTEEFKTFSIKSVKDNDSSVYECISENRAGSVSLRYQVKVEEAPRFSRHTRKTEFDSKLGIYREKIRIKIGKLLKLECQIVGKPTPDINWFSVNQSYSETLIPIPDAKGFQVAVVTTNNTGFDCIGNNTHGTVEKHFQIFPKYPPKLKNDSDTVIYVKPKKNFTLDCTTRLFDPVTTVNWFKNGRNIVIEGVKYVTSDDGYILTVVNVSPDMDPGNYACILENDVGSTKKYFNIKNEILTQWTSWSPWSRCNCSRNIHFRVRYCRYKSGGLTAPQHRRYCTGDAIQTQLCSC